MNRSSELIREDYFAALVYHTYHQDSEKLNNSLVDKIYSLRENDKEGVHRSNNGGWQSQDISKNKDFASVTDWIKDVILEIGDDMNLNTHFNFENMWVNINGKGHYNREHTHPFSQLSGVYYVKSPSLQSKIIFTDPRIANNHFPINHSDSIFENWDKRHLWSTVSFTPEEGKLLIFPGWLHHYVEPNESDEDRISISFNIQQY